MKYLVDSSPLNSNLTTLLTFQMGFAGRFYRYVLLRIGDVHAWRNVRPAIDWLLRRHVFRLNHRNGGSVRHFMALWHRSVPWRHQDDDRLLPAYAPLLEVHLEVFHAPCHSGNIRLTENSTLNFFLNLILTKFVPEVNIFYLNLKKITGHFDLFVDRPPADEIRRLRLPCGSQCDRFPHLFFIGFHVAHCGHLQSRAAQEGQPAGAGSVTTATNKRLGTSGQGQQWRWRPHSHRFANSAHLILYQ